MRSKTKELDVDFIGGQGPMTKEEEQQISDYIRNQKLLRAKRQHRNTRGLPQRKKVVA